MSGVEPQDRSQNFRLSLDTHAYDRHLTAPPLPRATSTQVAHLVASITDPLATRFLLAIIADGPGKQGCGARNYDPDDDLHAYDLLEACATLGVTQELVDVLTEQLRDMATGFCPQGRTHRLLSVFQAFSST